MNNLNNVVLEGEVHIVKSSATKDIKWRTEVKTETGKKKSVTSADVAETEE